MGNLHTVSINLKRLWSGSRAASWMWNSFLGVWPSRRGDATHVTLVATRLDWGVETEFPEVVAENHQQHKLKMLWPIIESIGQCLWKINLNQPSERSRFCYKGYLNCNRKSKLLGKEKKNIYPWQVQEGKQHRKALCNSEKVNKTRLITHLVDIGNILSRARIVFEPTPFKHVRTWIHNKYRSWHSQTSADLQHTQPNHFSHMRCQFIFSSKSISLNTRTVWMAAGLGRNLNLRMVFTNGIYVTSRPIWKFLKENMSKAWSQTCGRYYKQSACVGRV